MVIFGTAYKDVLALLLPMLRRHEGLRVKPYQCSAGHWTIGYGHNLQAHPIAGRTLDDLKVKGITNGEAETLLMGDAVASIDDCSQLFPNWSEIDTARKVAMADIMFNIGRTSFSEFHRFRDAIAIKDYEKAADELVDSLWYGQVKSRGVELVKIMRAGTI